MILASAGTVVFPRTQASSRSAWTTRPVLLQMGVLNTTHRGGIAAAQALLPANGRHRRCGQVGEQCGFPSTLDRTTVDGKLWVNRLPAVRYSNNRSDLKHTICVPPPKKRAANRAFQRMRRWREAAQFSVGIAHKCGSSSCPAGTIRIRADRLPAGTPHATLIRCRSAPVTPAALESGGPGFAPG
jgi:hypothetical protein